MFDDRPQLRKEGLAPRATGGVAAGGEAIGARCVFFASFFVGQTKKEVNH